MKKATLIILVIIYSLSVLGVGLKEFYCCGKLQSVSVTILHSEGEKCGMDENNDDCCKTNVHFKVADKHVAPVEVSDAYKGFLDLQIFSCNEHTTNTVVQETSPTVTHSPPLTTGVPLYIYNCVFRV